MGGFLGVGIDIADIGRFAAHAKALPEGPATRYLTPYEAEEALIRTSDRAEYLASRFAAKEAVMKSLGCGMDDVSFKEIEIRPDGKGRPTAELTGRALARLRELGAGKVLVSISHGKEQAVAMAAAVPGDGS
ncbi:MAG TPA: holo-ACP synthase [Bacillota bacterium]|mgnify:CR=1 FL=1|nr:MAG: Holo-(acyl-carrier-protein) synthase [Firmicutes bacterium ADurb.Bin153]HNV34551.1 holo-ACP synthase [Bacillota bacterium]HPU95882.1 holo-ACP synthase [Bacillota bacterium]